MMLERFFRWAHELTHQHAVVEKEGVGQFRLCCRKWDTGNVDIRFRPDYDEARWHWVPPLPDGQVTMNAMLGTESAFEAMAVLRAAPKYTGG
jgi:hypothetical protein